MKTEDQLKTATKTEAYCVHLFFSMSFNTMSQGFRFYSFSIFYVRIYKTVWGITFILSIFTEPEHMKFPGREAL